MKLLSIQQGLASFVALLPVSTAAISIVVDQSCDGKIPNVLNDATTMASRAQARLSNDNDDNQANVFQRLFMMPKTDTNTFNEVQRRFKKYYLSAPC